MISLPLFVSGIILILFNLTTLYEAIFPIVFLTFLTPPPVVFLNNVGSMLSVGSTQAANTIANFLGIESWITVVSGTPAINLIRPDSQPLLLIVDVACSGIYSLVGFVVFASFLAYIVRDKYWKKIVIIAIGFPLILFLNIIRITTIVLIGYQWGAELALEIFHILGGWVLVFLGTLLLLVIAEQVFKTRIFTKANKTTQGNNIQLSNKKISLSSIKNLRKPKNRIQTTNTVKIVAVIVVAILFVYIQSPLFSLARGPAPLLIQTPYGQQGNPDLFPQIENYEIGFLYRDTDFEQISGQDFSLAFKYYPENVDDIEVDVALEVAASSISLHPWEICLVQWAVLQGYQPVSQLDLRDITIQADPPIVARYFAFEDPDKPQIQLVLYYFTTAVFEIDNATQRKLVKLSFITFLDNPEDLNAIEDELFPFAENTVNYWEPLNKVNLITLAISYSILPLAITVAAILVFLIPFSWIRKRKRFKENSTIYQKLHPHKKQIIEAIRETEKMNLPTLKNITKNLQKQRLQAVEKAELLKNLAELEKLGLIVEKIVNEQDEPIYVWKIQF
jgi:exosortase/archaeosortase family protein